MTSWEAGRAIPHARPVPDPRSHSTYGRLARLSKMICLVFRVRHRDVILASDGVPASGLDRYRYFGRCGVYAIALYTIDNVSCESEPLWPLCFCSIYGGEGVNDIYCPVIDHVFIFDVIYTQRYLSLPHLDSDMNINIPLVTNATHMCNSFMLRPRSSIMIFIPICFYFYVMSTDDISLCVICIYTPKCTCLVTNVITYMKCNDELRSNSYISLHTTVRSGRVTACCDELYVHAANNAYFYI